MDKSSTSRPRRHHPFATVVLVYLCFGTLLFLLLGLAGAYITTTVVNNNNLQGQLNSLKLQQQYTQLELITLQMSMPNVTQQLLQSGTLDMYVANSAWLPNNPTVNYIDTQTTSYRLYAVDVTGTTFNVLEIDPPPLPLQVLSDPGTSLFGYNSVLFTFMKFNPPCLQLTALSASAGNGYPMSSANSRLLSISPDCYTAGACIVAGNEFVPSTGNFPSYNTFTFFTDNLRQPDSGVMAIYLVSLTNSPSYVFVGTNFTFTAPLRLVLPLL